MNINTLHNIYFIGIGGIGMSALAKYMLFIGKDVAGYDRTKSAITKTLETEGISLSFKDEISEVPKKYLDKNTLIVYTPAIKRKENNLLDYFISNDYKVIKRAVLLGIITKSTINLAVAGTHGKTTTSSILGHLLKDNNIDATSFLGGIAENYNSNLILGGTKYTVVEADEFDRSFLQLQPNIACITSIDADHLDIYDTPLALADTFKEFAALASERLFVKKGIPIAGITYGVEEEADYDAQNIRIKNASYIVDVKTPTEQFKDLKINLPGRHNIANTMAALAMANSIGISLVEIAKSLQTYKGVRRRFSYRLQNEKYVLIDDYAHHPTEIDAVCNTLRELYAKEEILCVFQPHTFTRTKDFEEDFVKSLAKFDKLFLLPIYAAREHPIKGVSSAVLVDKIKKHNNNVALISEHEITSKIIASKNKIILMLGAGDIGEMVTKVQHALASNI